MARAGGNGYPVAAPGVTSDHATHDTQRCLIRVNAAAIDGSQSAVTFRGGNKSGFATGEPRHQTDFTSPPSIRSAEPVIQCAAGDTTNAISSAISSGVP
ncbi:hypothetical protein BLA6992_07189 [Burkholderia lata]|nr:hypothetical protein BLA6992_07189 [Burkholderia lata]